MLIKIKETAEVKEITLTDPKTNLNWENDYILNAINSDQYEEPSEDEEGEGITCVMIQEEFDWWKNQCKEYQTADNLLHETREAEKEKNEYGECTDFDEKYHQYINGYDFNQQPAAMIAFCNNRQW